MTKVIFLFRQYASCPGVPGGRRHYNLLEEVSKQGVESYLFISSYSHVVKKNVRSVTDQFQLEKIGHVNIVWLPGFAYRKNNWRRAWNIVQYSIQCVRAAHALSKQGVKPDAVVGSVAHVFAVAAAWIVSKRMNVKFLIDVGDLWPEAFHAMGKMSDKSLIYKAMKSIMRFFYRRADAIICITKDMQQFFIDAGFGEKTTLVQPGMIVAADYAVEKNEPRPPVTRFVYGGSFQPVYPLDNLIRAAALLVNRGFDQFELELVGDGLERARLIELAKDLALDQISFVDPLPREEYIKRLENATACVLIEKNIAYGFPNKMLDYLQVGRPVIYASVAQHLVVDSGCCIVAQHSVPDDIAKAMFQVIQMSDEKWQEACVLARRFYVKEHDLGALAPNFIRALRL